uniref:uncharacterized protein LOC118533609 isoform X8 n=1 Tax=Halichoerus grypus TaxID=9711 RepID=UPI001659520F|nr:uncharacterized protein LOC118533609 isoform X8 [Halichoerus grypus]
MPAAVPSEWGWESLTRKRKSPRGFHRKGSGLRGTNVSAAKVGCEWPLSGTHCVSECTGLRRAWEWGACAAVPALPPDPLRELRPSHACVYAFLLFHETQATQRAAVELARARAARDRRPRCFIYRAVPSSQALSEAPLFSHGGLEGLEVWCDAQQILMEYLSRPWEGSDLAQGRASLPEQAASVTGSGRMDG